MQQSRWQRDNQQEVLRRLIQLLYPLEVHELGWRQEQEIRMSQQPLHNVHNQVLRTHNLVAPNLHLQDVQVEPQHNELTIAEEHVCINCKTINNSTMDFPQLTMSGQQGRMCHELCRYSYVI